MNSISGIIKYILESNIINFCLMAWLLVWICKKINIKSAFNNSIKSVKDYIEKSNIEKQNSNKLVKESQELIKKLPQDKKEIEDFAQQKSEIYKKQLEENEQKIILKIAKDIEDKKAVDEKTASNSVIQYSFKKSIKKVENDILEKLKSKPELKYKFIDKSLEELDRISL